MPTSPQFSWPADAEYPSLDGTEVQAERSLAIATLEQLEALQQALSSGPSPETSAALIATLQEAEAHYWQVRAIGDQLLYLGYSELAVDSANQAAQSLASTGEALLARLARAWQPFLRCLATAPMELLTEYQAHPKASRASFSLVHASRRRSALSPDQYTVLSHLEPHGLVAWQRQYKDLLGGLRCRFTLDGEPRELGAAEASNRLQGPRRAERQAVWEARNRAWEAQAPIVARCLNAITGWRLSVHALEHPKEEGDLFPALCHSHLLSRTSIDQMFATLHRGRDTVQRGLRVCAAVAGLDRLAPWDLFAPAPWHTREGPLSLEACLALMEQAFTQVLPEMGDFIRQLTTRRYLDAREGPRRRPGGFAALMPRSGNIRVFGNWAGSRVSMGILAHELGHGFHFSTLAGQPYHGMCWPPSLEETPSTFAELALADELIASASSEREAGLILWQQLLYAAHALLGAASTSTLEQEILAARKNGPLTPDTLFALSEAASSQWYGDVLAPKSRHRWLLGRHYYVAEAPFASIRYLFSYLLAQALMAWRASRVETFGPTWLGFLADLGQGSVRELLQRHFGLDLHGPEIWQLALERVAAKVDQLEALHQRGVLQDST